MENIQRFTLLVLQLTPVYTGALN